MIMNFYVSRGCRGREQIDPRFNETLLSLFFCLYFLVRFKHWVNNGQLFFFSSSTASINKYYHHRNIYLYIMFVNWYMKVSCESHHIRIPHISYKYNNNNNPSVIIIFDICLFVWFSFNMEHTFCRFCSISYCWIRSSRANSTRLTYVWRHEPYQRMNTSRRKWSHPDWRRRRPRPPSPTMSSASSTSWNFRSSLRQSWRLPQQQLPPLLMLPNHFQVSRRRCQHSPNYQWMNANCLYDDSGGRYHCL